MGSTLRLISFGQRFQVDPLHRKWNGGGKTVFHCSSHRVRKQWAVISTNIFCPDLAKCLSIRYTKGKPRSSWPNSIGLSTVRGKKENERSSVPNRSVTSSAY